MKRCLSNEPFPKLSDLKKLVHEKKFDELDSLRNKVMEETDSTLDFRIWDGKLLAMLDQVFVDKYFVSDGKKGCLLHPAFTTNTDASHKMWSEYHEAIINKIAAFEADTDGHKLPVSFIARGSSWSSSGIALPAVVIHSQYSPTPPLRRTTRCYETSRIQSERYAILMFLWFPLPYQTGPVGEMSASYTPPQGLCVLIYLCLSPLLNLSDRGTVFSHPPIASRNRSYYCFY